MALNEDGRRFGTSQEARLEKGEEGLLVVTAPGPGLYRHGPSRGTEVQPGGAIGQLEVLGALITLRAPSGARGRVTEPKEELISDADRALARRPVGYGTPLFVLDPKATAGGDLAHEEEDEEDAHGPVFRTPLGGRFYCRPSPDAPPFVEPGQLLVGGETVALIEVMKTFNRVTYSADRPARVQKVAIEDGEDVRAGDVLLYLVPSDGSSEAP